MLAEGARVRALVRRAESMAALPTVEVIPGEITDEAAVRAAVDGVDYVIHCAAYAGPDRAESIRINGGGSGLLAEAAREAGAARFVQISTQSVYAGDGLAVIDETTPRTREGNAYSVGKAASEEAVEAAAARGLAATIIRPPAILGAHPTSMWGVKIARMIKNRQFKLVGDGSGPLPYLHVENLAEAVVLILRSPAAVGQAYNLVDGFTTWKAFTDLFRRWLGVEEPLESVDQEQVSGPFGWRGLLSGEKAVRELGYSPQWSYAEAMAETEAYLEEHGV